MLHAGKGTEEDMGDCPKTCGGQGCTHADDVGLCCWGLNDQFQVRLDPAVLY